MLSSLVIVLNILENNIRNISQIVLMLCDFYFQYVLCLCFLLFIIYFFNIWLSYTESMNFLKIHWSWNCGSVTELEPWVHGWVSFPVPLIFCNMKS